MKHDITIQFLSQLLDGSEKVSVKLGQARCPALWPRANGDLLRDVQDERRSLIKGHLAGAPSTVMLCPAGKPERPTRLTETHLAAYIPWPDGRCPFGAIDLDSADGHGPGGLADVRHAVRAICSVADELGILDGVTVAPSGSETGRHIFVVPPVPARLDDMVIALAALVARSYDAAEADVTDSGGDVPHAFRTANGEIARPGAAGAVELAPKSTARPPIGWSMALPRSIRDGFTDDPVTLVAMPRCNATAWASLIRDARAMLPSSKPKPRTSPRFAKAGPRSLDRLIGTLDPRAREFLRGATAEGGRNAAAFAAACALFGRGVPDRDVERLVQEGADRCGLPTNEAATAVKSARRAVQR